MAANNADNSYHVIASNAGINATAVLDGFTITGGNANGSYNLSRGGGMHNSESSPTLSNLTLQANTASADGGGMYNIASSPTLTNVTFSANSALYGAGMFNNHSSPELSQVTFNANLTSGTTGRGGGMYNFYYSDPKLSKVNFTGNKAQWGGGMHNYDHSNPIIQNNSSFINNEAKADGGGLLSDTNCIATLSQVEFTGNKAVSYGGGMEVILVNSG